MTNTKSWLDMTDEERAARRAENEAKHAAKMAAALASMTPEAIAAVDALVADVEDAYNTLPCTKMGLRDLTLEQIDRLTAWKFRHKLQDIAKAMVNVPAFPDFKKVDRYNPEAMKAYHAALEAHRVEDQKRTDLTHALHLKYEALTDKMCGIVRVPGVDEWRLEAPRAKLIENEIQRRKRAKTTAANQAEMANTAAPSQTFALNETVEVHAMGHWYKGIVKSFNKNGRAVVTYTSGTGTTRDKTVSHDKIRKVAK